MTYGFIHFHKKWCKPDWNREAIRVFSRLSRWRRLQATTTLQSSLFERAYLNSVEFFANDRNHSINFFMCHRSRSWLFLQQIHNMCCEVIASLIIFFQFLIVSFSYLSQLASIFCMLNKRLVVVTGGGCGFWGYRGRIGPAPFRSSHALGNQHVIYVSGV